MAGKSAQVTVTVDRTSALFILVGFGLGYYLARRKYAYWGEEE